MDLQLFEFQKKAIRDILSEMFIKHSKLITLQAPTGSGKTVILSKLVDIINDIAENGAGAPSLFEIGCSQEQMDAFDFNEIQTMLAKNEFVWFSPSTGGLTTQSKSSYEETVGNKSQTLKEFINNPSTDNNIITFIGMSSVNSGDNTVHQKSEQGNWNDIVSRKKISGMSFVVIVDESHMFDTDKRESLIWGDDSVEGLCPLYQINASATPHNEGVTVLVKEDDVIAEELITRYIRINNDLPAAKDEDMENQILIDTAIKKYLEIKAEYERMFKAGLCAEEINPLIIIQYPNKDYGDSIFEKINDYLKSKHYSDDEGGEIAKWMTVNRVEQKINLDNITKNNSNVIFLHMKQAVATGWNCPRAKILVKLRERGAKTFETQVIGRFRRMPERKHYGSVLLDDCYIYTYDRPWVELGEKSGSFMQDQHLTIKEDINLPATIYSESRNSNAMTIGPLELLQLIATQYVEKYNLDTDVKSNKDKLQKAGYKFLDTSYLDIYTGKVSHLDKIEEETVEERRKRIIKEDSLALRRALERINSKTRICDLDVTKKILNKLFQEKTNSHSRAGAGVLLNLTAHQYRQFVVNNEELLYRDVRDFLQAKQNQHDQRAKASITRKEYSLPTEYDVKINSKIVKPVLYTNSAYSPLRDNIKASVVEREFSEFIDNYSKTDWWMKNGDVGDDFLSVVYITIIGKQAEFYPDYLCSIDGKLWVLETKGGEDSNGQDENIDAQAENKFYALKDWALANNVEFGFVRYSKLQNKLYISNTEYSEQMDLENPDSPWKEIEEFFK